MTAQLRGLTLGKFVAVQHGANHHVIQASYIGLRHTKTWPFSTELILTEYRYWQLTRAYVTHLVDLQHGANPVGT
jgi:hypothetical protein